MTRSRFGGDQPADFVLLAIDGLQARLDAFQTSLDALRRATEGMLGTHQPQSDGKQPRQQLALPPVVHVAPAGPGHGGKSWANMTERSAEMRRRMEVGRQKAAATKRSRKMKASWTPERRAAAAIEAKRRWKAGVYASKSTQKRNAKT